MTTPNDTINDLTAQRLRSILDYDSESGEFTWRGGRVGIRPGSKAGSFNNPNGSLRIKVDGRLYCLHRLAWLYVHGRWPVEFLDHINRDRSDNRIKNLRECSKSQNLHNMRRNPRSGFKGVRMERSGRWSCKIIAFGKRYHIGTFDTREEAFEAYKEKAREVHGEFACF